MAKKNSKEKFSGDVSKMEDNENIQEPRSAAMAETRPVEELSAALDAAESEAASLQVQLAETQAKLDEYRDQSLRAMADFQNLRRRTEREMLAANQNATANVVKRYLEIFDDLERAMKKRPENDEEAQRWVDGVELTYRKFLKFLENEGVSLIDAEGKPFDPNIHEAISQEDSPDHESGTVIGVVQQGYRLGDRVLRPARVRVAR
jgi:molecular chaperone GrpE